MPIRFLIVRDHKENKKKCTLSPLVGREDCEFVDLPHPKRARGLIEIGGGILLAPDAPELGAADAQWLVAPAGARSGRVVLIDSTWARVRGVLERLRVRPEEQLVERALPSSLCTAYPRRSKLYEDPSRGLASVEALFVAALILGDVNVDLLREYRWAEAFLERNRLTLERLGWDPRPPS